MNKRMEWDLKMIYLDSTSTERPLPCAIESFQTALTEYFGNPSSGHAYGQRARQALEEARATIAECINACPNEIYFTSGATEACNWAVNCMANSCVGVSCSPYEHHAVMASVDRYDSLGDEELFGTATMLVCNETGDILDAPRDKGITLCDATSALGHIPVDVSKMGVTYLTGGGHKFGAVPGAGFLYAKKGAFIAPEIVGGGQERGMRAGTENVPAICSMAAALKWQTDNMTKNTLHVMRLKTEMLNGLKGADYMVNAMGEASPYILNVSFPGVENGALALMLSKENVMVSTGAACTTGDNAPSHVLMAIYGDEARARSAIRISFSHTTTEDEVKIAAKKIVDCVKTLRGMTGWQK